MATSPLITITSDFGVQSQGTGIMEAVAFRIAPQAKFIHLMHGLPEFNIMAAARTVETVRYIPVGFHVCVCDPGVGTHRKAIICLVARGDYLIAPDNGVLLPAAGILGGIREVREINNPRYMNEPVSPLFHGRDVFVPAAAHLASGVPFTEFGPVLDQRTLSPAPYSEAVLQANKVHAQIIQVNRFGSIHLNITHEAWDSLGLHLGSDLALEIAGRLKLAVPFRETFGQVEPGEPVLMKDDYGRVEIAINRGSFVARYPATIGEEVVIDLPAHRLAGEHSVYLG